MAAKYFFFILLLSNICCGQTFVPVDEETLEFVEDVNYNLFLGKINVFSGTCSNDKPTSVPDHVEYDSISFSKINYKTVGLRKENLPSVLLLTKLQFDLDEVVVMSSRADKIILGEKKRFIKRYSRPILRGLQYGIAIENQSKIDLKVENIIFYIEKVKHKTAYKLNIIRLSQKPIAIGFQNLELNEKVFSTDTLYLVPNQKNEIKVSLSEGLPMMKEDIFFIYVELMAYYDQNNNLAEPETEDRTRLKFQTSEKANYFGKYHDLTTGRLTKELYNINARTNYDFAFDFLGKPNKSDIVAPAVLLQAKRL